MKETILKAVINNPRTSTAMVLVCIFCVGAMVAGASFGEALMMFSAGIASLLLFNFLQ